MSFWNEARVALYRELNRRLPVSVRTWIGQSALIEPLRRRWLWPQGVGSLVETPVDFEGRQFKFASPVKVAASVRQRGGVENGLCRLVLKECPAGGVALDVGANYGFITLVMAHAVGSSGHVHSFEADAAITEALRSNVSRNGFDDRCTVAAGFVGREHEGARIAIDQYVAEHAIQRVDFLKIDVDGPDLAVLEGARKTLQRFHPIVVIELTRDEAAIVSFLRELGYECTDMKGQDLDPRAWPPNVLAARGRRLAVPARGTVTSARVS